MEKVVALAFAAVFAVGLHLYVKQISTRINSRPKGRISEALPYALMIIGVAGFVFFLFVFFASLGQKMPITNPQLKKTRASALFLR